MNNRSLIIIFALASIALTACQGGTPERPINTAGDRRNEKPEVPIEEVLPSLKINAQGQASELKLRSQTSRYLNEAKSELEIVLTSSKVAFCQNEKPELLEGEEEVRLTVKSKDGKKAVVAADYANNADYEISAVRKTPAGETTFSPENFKSFKVTDLNNAIVRGNINIVAKDMSIEGEYFTAICK
jgi:hypothetical protein